MKTEKPNLVFVGHHVCGRYIKEAYALKRLGYELDLVSEQTFDDKALFSRRIRYGSEQSLFDSLELFDSEKVIFHVHNEPSWMVSVVREKFPTAKIVFDVHDSNYFRIDGDFQWWEENAAADHADAFVFPSLEAAEKFPNKGDKPWVVLPSANPFNWFRFGGWDYYGGLVSEGGHVIARTDTPQDVMERWRDYTNVYTEFVSHGKDVFAYCPSFGDPDSTLDQHYHKLGAKLGSFNHHDLLDALGRHEWALIGNTTDHRVWEYALPNKFFDAMAAGIPVLNFGCAAAKKYVDEYDIGLNVESVDEAIERWDECSDKRSNVLKNRRVMTMESGIDGLEQLYEQL